MQHAYSSCQKNSAAFALGMLLGLLGVLASTDDFLRALPLGFAVGGVLTSAGGTGPPLAKYRFLFSANFTCAHHRVSFQAFR